MSDTDRQHWMSILARADTNAIEAASRGLLPAYTILRGPEPGGIMLRGRAGGGGQPFNLGEATVVRCTVRSEAGHIGHAYCLGRDLRHAELAAVIDAGLQDNASRAALYEKVIAPLAELQAADQARAARQAAATQVQFFTMATMRT